MIGSDSKMVENDSKMRGNDSKMIEVVGNDRNHFLKKRIENGRK